MIDFKEKLHNDVQAVLEESIQLDEGLGSVLGTGLKGLGKGVIGTGKLLGKGIQSGKKLYDDRKIKKARAKEEELITNNTQKTVNETLKVLDIMNKRIKQFQKVKSVEDALKIAEALKAASGDMNSQMNRLCLNYKQYMKERDSTIAYNMDKY